MEGSTPFTTAEEFVGVIVEDCTTTAGGLAFSPFEELMLAVEVEALEVGSMPLPLSIDGLLLGGGIGGI